MQLFAAVLVAAALVGSRASAEDATIWFDKAVQYDLSGGDAVPLAYEWYKRAAEAGLPEAEFNVAVMLDSGRGVEHDIAQAAIWYARAATHGNRRAAYNLGQLYESGQGVPRNADIARAWFAASDLAAARVHLVASRPPMLVGTVLSAPIPVAPNHHTDVDPSMDGVELVWTAKSQPESVHFFVELRALGPVMSREVFSGFAGTTAVFAALPDMRGDYAWRVLAVAREADRYVASDWLRFSISHR